MLSLLAFLFLAYQPDSAEAIYIQEEIRHRFPGGEVEVHRRDIWIGKNEVRVEREEDNEKKSIIFVPLRQAFYVVNHTRKSYYYVLTGRDRQLQRLPFYGLAPFNNGVFSKPPRLLFPTNQSRRISRWQCDEFQLKYPNQSGVTTTVWVTKEPTPLDNNSLKRFWYTMLGTTNIHYDVRYIFNRLVEDMQGTPIRTVTTIEQEEMRLTTVSTILTLERRRTPYEDFFSIPSTYQLEVREDE